jgi:anaerobic ribonucleoside-triphosphate reductase activating protein
MRIAGIVRDSIVDGIGVRDVVFFQGCKKHCKGCHNPDTWNYKGGCDRTVEDVVEELSDSSNNVTISGGEPFDQYDDLLELCRLFYEQGKTVWVYTGNVVNPEKLIYEELMYYVEVIVDGRFVEEKKDSSLLFRGSSNQRIIDLRWSVLMGEIIEWRQPDEDLH